VRTFLQLTAALALLCLSVSTVVLSRDMHQLALDSSKTLRDIDDSVRTQNINLAQDEMHLDSVLQSIDAAANEQRAYWQKTSADSDKTVKALRLAVDRASLLLDHTDKQLNGALLPDFDRQLNMTAESAQLAFGSVGHATDALTFQINDLGPTLTSLGEGSAQLAKAAAYLVSASGHANNILADGEKTADYYEKKLTTPLSFAHQLANGLLDVGSKAGNIVTGFVK
jgi:hypothetical protein